MHWADFFHNSRFNCLHWPRCVQWVYWAVIDKLSRKNTYLCCGVFLYYSGLVSVVVPKTLCCIIENPFMGCENLLSIEVSEQNYNITSITEFCSARTGKSCSVLQQGEVWEVFYPIWCGVICANLFCGCSKLESV